MQNGLLTTSTPAADQDSTSYDSDSHSETPENKSGLNGTFETAKSSDSYFQVVSLGLSVFLLMYCFAVTDVCSKG